MKVCVLIRGRDESGWDIRMNHRTQMTHNLEVVMLIMAKILVTVLQESKDKGSHRRVCFKRMSHLLLVYPLQK